MLFECVYLLGFSRRFLALFGNFQTETEQCIRNGNLGLKTLRLLSGVAKGCVLRPLFFMVFINDLPLIMSHCSGFADEKNNIGQCCFSADKRSKIGKLLEVPRDEFKRSENTRKLWRRK